MISKEKIDRINELAKKSKLEPLSDLEKQEQSTLRREYLDAVKANFEQTLQSIEFVDEDKIKH